MVLLISVAPILPRHEPGSRSKELRQLVFERFDDSE